MLSSPTASFQVLIDRLGHLKHVQLFAAENGLQLVIGEDLALVRWILKLILLNVRLNLFRDLTARSGSAPTILASCSEGCIGFMKALFVFVLPAAFAIFSPLKLNSKPVEL
jgi:hypothetical protein